MLLDLYLEQNINFLILNSHKQMPKISMICIKGYMLPGHPLNKALSEMVICDSNLHLLVSRIGITVTQKHNLIHITKFSTSN